MSSKPVIPRRLQSHLQPWKPHARRLAAAGRGLRTVAAMLTEFYGFSISYKAVRHACKGRGAAPGILSVGSEKLTESQRDRQTDRAESWLARNDPDYVESRRQWQQPRTDALARICLSSVEPKAEDDEETRSHELQEHALEEMADGAPQIGREVESGPHVGGTARPFEYEDEAG